jgi:hypothetical protein
MVAVTAIHWIDQKGFSQVTKVEELWFERNPRKLRSIALDSAGWNLSCGE